jgi:hypothetical protein
MGGLQPDCTPLKSAADEKAPTTKKKWWKNKNSSKDKYTTNIVLTFWVLSINYNLSNTGNGETPQNLSSQILAK